MNEDRGHAKPKFPKTVYVYREFNRAGGADSWLVAQEAAAECDDGPVAIYELREVVVKTTKTILTPSTIT